MRTRRGPVLLAALVLAGCGGGGGGDGGGGPGADGADGADETKAYSAAHDICEPGLQAVAESYAIDPPTREAVLALVEELVVTTATPSQVRQARKGCSDALDGK